TIDEDIFHMTVGCSLKHIVWNNIITIYLPPYFTIHDIFDSITTLNTPSDITNLVPYFTIIGTILHHLWRAYWRSIIHNNTFDAYTITSFAIILHPTSVT
ncbi:hypothetical protein BC941DRAFT_359165, partial [Chlamydoabsidia padenii]